MRVNYQSFIGKKFGKLTVVSFSDSNGVKYVTSNCECGEAKTSMWNNVRRGLTKSCGCGEIASRIKHGLTGSKTHTTWENMVNRCTPNSKQSKNAIGYQKVKVCDRWRRFENFLKDMGERPSGTSLDRIDNDKGYSKENCRWATQSQQMNNRRVCIKIEIDGQTKTLSEWCKHYGVRYMVAWHRIKTKGMTPRVAFGLEKQ